LVGIAAVLVAVIGPSVARAQRPSDKAIAEALFRDGKQRLEAGDIDGACPKFQDSQRIDPALGTLLFLAICHERQGRTATAWSEFSSAASWADRSAQGERGELARKHAAALEARLWRLTIHAVKTPGMELRVDNGLMSAAAADIPLPLDPGEHAVEASAPNFKTWHGTVQVPAEAGNGQLEIPALEAAPVASAPAAVSPPAGSASLDVPPPPPPGPGRAIGMWTAAVVGVAGIATGAVFGILTLQERDDAKRICHAYPSGNGGWCDPGGLTDISRAYTYSTVSNVGFGVGAAGAIVATYFLLLGGGRSAEPAVGPAGRLTIAPEVSSRDLGISVGGRFQ
jgi:hypothetical protein